MEGRPFRTYPMVPLKFKLSTRTFPFDNLFPELKDYIFKFLPLDDLKNVRLVSPVWKSMASRYIGMKNPILNQDTISMFSKSKEIFKELTVWNFTFDMCRIFNPGRHIKKITFKETTLSSQKPRTGIVDWILKSCPNVEEVNIFDLHISWNSDSLWPKLLGICKNLKKLQIYILPNEIWLTWKFDCGLLGTCTKLEEFHIFSIRASISLHNSSELPKSVRSYSVLVLMGTTHPPGGEVAGFERTYQTLCTQFDVQPSTAHVPNLTPLPWTGNIALIKICPVEKSSSIQQCIRQLELADVDGDGKVYLEARKFPRALLYFSKTE